MALQPIAEDEEGESQGGSAYWRVDMKHNLCLDDLGTFLEGIPRVLEPSPDRALAERAQG